MSPVSKRRKPASASRSRRGPAGRPSSRRAPALDVLTRELAKLAGVDDAFTVEGVGTYLFDVLDQRGPEPDDAFEAFCRDTVDDARATTSPLGVQALALVAALGPAGVRADAQRATQAAPDEVRAALPGWVGALGAVHLVEGGALRTLDGGETVLHLLLDYDDPAAGSRHLLTMAIEHRAARVHLLDVRGRGADDTLAPMAEQYAGSEEPVWSWVQADDLAALVEDAVRETARHRASDWPVLDVDNGTSAAWTLGVRRLEQLTGLDLGPREVEA
jgi:hypothetical protein